MVMAMMTFSREAPMVAIMASASIKLGKAIKASITRWRIRSSAPPRVRADNAHGASDGDPQQTRHHADIEGDASPVDETAQDVPTQVVAAQDVPILPMANEEGIGIDGVGV